MSQSIEPTYQCIEVAPRPPQPALVYVPDAIDIDQSINQPNNQPNNQRPGSPYERVPSADVIDVNQSLNEPINQSTNPWINRALILHSAWTNWRWRKLFFLYRPIKLFGIGPWSLIEWLIAALFIIVNGAVLIACIVGMSNDIGASDNAGSINQSINESLTFQSNSHGNRTKKEDDDVSGSALQLGTLGTLNIMAVIILGTRNSLVTILTGMSFERTVVWHRWIARVGLIILLGHAIGALTQYGVRGTLSENALDGVFETNGSGLIAMIAGLLILITSIGPIRRFFFEAFLRAHWIFYIVFVIFGMAHASTFVVLMVIAMILWVIDWLIRFRVWRRPVHISAIQALAADVVRIDFKQPGFRYSSGQWIMVCIPAISPFEWHPFSLSSSPHQSSVMIHVRALGDWTKRLQKLAIAQPIGECNLTMYIEGPYGELSLPLHDYNSVICLSGGIGITPMQSIFNSLIHKASIGKWTTMNQLRFVWSVRDVEIVHSLYGAKLQQVHAAALPPAFQPDLVTPDSSLLSKLPSEMRKKVITEFCLTSGFSTMSPEHLKQLRDCYGDVFTPGRPKLHNILNEMKQTAIQTGDKRIAVLVCGPGPLVDDVIAAGFELSDEQCQFDVHTEVFEF